MASCPGAITHMDHVEPAAGTTTIVGLAIFGIAAPQHCYLAAALAIARGTPGRPLAYLTNGACRVPAPAE